MSAYIKPWQNRLVQDMFIGTECVRGISPIEARDAEIAELRAALSTPAPIPAQTQSIREAGSKLSNIAFNLAQDEILPAAWRASMDESWKEWDAAVHAAPVTQQAAGNARQRQVLHDLAIAAAERWAVAEFKNAKNLGAGGLGLESECNDMERAARRAIANLAGSPPSEGEPQ